MQKHMINLDYLSLLYKGLFFYSTMGQFLSHSWGSFVSLFYILNYPKKVLVTLLKVCTKMKRRISMEKLPNNLNILLLRATLPKSQDTYRDITSGIFAQKTGATVNLVPNVSHMLHWDNPEVVIKEIRERW